MVIIVHPYPKLFCIEAVLSQSKEAAAFAKLSEENTNLKNELEVAVEAQAQVPHHRHTTHLTRIYS